MPHAVMSPPTAPEAPCQPTHGRSPVVSEATVETYARQARKMYEAQPHMSLLALIRLVAKVLLTGKAPRTYKL
jgi:hypothetical protein